ncbi:MAG: DUF748 domain-containing protein, partial [Deltaproteobacteria bacterium]|nr:DUF748 domain-containing protein [Deltaproteobacteria bacterium]
VLKNLDSKGKTPADLFTRLKINGKGEVSMNGNVSPFPLTADLNLDIKNVELLPLQPLFSEKLNVAVTRGQISSNGTLQLRQSEPV